MMNSVLGESAGSKALNQREEGAVLKYKKNPRMAGKVPVWEKPSTSKDMTTQRLDMAGKKSFESFIGTASFAQQQALSSENMRKPFGFGDLIDMVNPLHHVPLLGGVYREVTGDEIRDVSKVIGGAVFGGPAGAAGSAANVALKNTTGKDALGHVTGGLIFTDSAQRASAYAAYNMNAIEPGASKPEPMDPKEEIQQIGRKYISEKSRFLGEAVEVTDLIMDHDILFEQVDAGERMAGTISREVENIRELLPPRQSITEVTISRLKE